MAEVDALEQLVHERFGGSRLEGTPLSVGVHVSLEVAVHEFEDEHELILGMDDIVKGDNVLVFEFLHKRNLSDRR